MHPTSKILLPVCLLLALLSPQALAANTWKKLVSTTTSIQCPSGYVAVPQYTLPDGTFVPAFCVMQFEAQNGGNGIAASNPGASPWTSLTFTQASSACSAAGARLISENEWLSIAHQASEVASNWTGGAVGSGVLFSGHTDQAPASILSAPSSAAASCYTGTNDAATGTGDGAFNGYATNTINASPTAGQCRTLTLLNGSVIWDMAGNLWEWVRETLAKGSRYHGGAAGTMSYSSNDGAISGNSYSIATLVPINKVPKYGWNATQGMGRYYDGINASGAYNSVSEWPDSAGTGYVAPYAAVIRGGAYTEGATAGIFALSFNNGRSLVGGIVTFRCTR